MLEGARLPQLRIGAVIAIAVAAGLGTWLGTRSTGHAAPIVASQGQTGKKKVVPITLAGLETLASVLRRPIYWAGPEPGRTYELTDLPNGNMYVRYLTSRDRLGTSKPLLTVGTYQVAGAFAITLRNAAQPGSVRVPDRTGTVAFYSRAAPTNIYLAFSGADYQVEVYDPSPSQARQLVASGKIVPVR